MQLSLQQEEAFKLILEFMKDGTRSQFVLSGYAGTGKTTLARYISHNTDYSVLFCAYTGKAAHVLRSKGCSPAGTIHSFLYVYEGKGEDGKPRFRRVEKQNCDLYKADLVICDEYSMLPEDIISDLQKNSKKILFLGDNFQLPPVRGECTLTPDYTLTDVQRQALESGIIRAATDLRTRGHIPYTKESDFIFLPKTKIDREVYYQVEQTIVGYNRTRVKWNEIFRRKSFGDDAYNQEQLMGFCINGHPARRKGDKIICLKNNRDYGVYNGLIAEVVSAGQYDISFKDDTQTLQAPDDYSCWMEEKIDTNTINKEKAAFDFAYAITCHKSQGSEFGSVLIANEPLGADRDLKNRWVYTAITRARDLCYLVDMGK